MTPAQKKRPTLREVAEQAGVSTATVSLVVNGKASDAGITAATQALVLAAIEKLQYTPNRMASAVVTGRSRIVGVVSALSSELFDTKFGPKVLSGFARGARELGYHFVLLEDVLSPNPDVYAQVLKRARELCVEGLILLVDIGHEKEFQEVKKKIASALPYVNVQFTFDPEGEPGFRVDHAAAAREVVDYLVGLGHQRIGFGARRTDVERSRATVKLIRDSLAQHGISMDSGLVFEIPPWEQMKDFVEMVREKKPTALFTLYDGEAARAIGALREEGVRVPEDISIVGYGDSPLAKHIYPPLTAYRPPMEEIGYSAIQHLIQSIENGTDPTLKESRDLDGSVIVRNTSGPPPNSQ
jgi:LacI family transcriptional regulator